MTAPTDWQYQLGPIYFNTAQEPDAFGCLYVMPEPAGWDSPALRLSPVDIPYADGADIPDSYWSARTIHGQGTIVAPSVPALVAARSRLSQATQLLRQDGQFIENPPDGTGPRYCTVRRLGPTAYPTRYSTGENGLEAIAFDFQLVAGDPLKYDLTPQVVTVSSSTVVGGLTFPVTFPITFAPDADVLTSTASSTNLGNADTGYQADFNGPLRNPVLIDRLAGGRIALTANIPTGRTVTVDTRALSVMIDGEPVWDWFDPVKSTPLSQLVIPAEGQCDWLLLGQGSGQVVVTSKSARE